MEPARARDLGESVEVGRDRDTTNLRELLLLTVQEPQATLLEMRINSVMRNSWVGAGMLDWRIFRRDTLT